MHHCKLISSKILESSDSSSANPVLYVKNKRNTKRIILWDLVSTKSLTLCFFFWPGLTKFSFGKSLWLVWVLLFHAPIKARQPKSFTSRMMTLLWSFVCLTFIASYTANLAAFMIIREEVFLLYSPLAYLDWKCKKIFRIFRFSKKFTKVHIFWKNVSNFVKKQLEIVFHDVYGFYG